MLGRGDLVRDFACVMFAIVVRLCVVGAGVDGSRFSVVALEPVFVDIWWEVCGGALGESSAECPIEVEAWVGFD